MKLLTYEPNPFATSLRITFKRGKATTPPRKPAPLKKEVIKVGDLVTFEGMLQGKAVTGHVLAVDGDYAAVDTGERGVTYHVNIKHAYRVGEGKDV